MVMEEGGNGRGWSLFCGARWEGGRGVCCSRSRDAVELWLSTRAVTELADVCCLCGVVMSPLGFSNVFYA